MRHADSDKDSCVEEVHDYCEGQELTGSPKTEVDVGSFVFQE